MKRVAKAVLGESRISEERRAELIALSERPDSEIDLSDIPELTESFWRNAVRNPFYKPVKKQVTVRVDADVLQWLREKAPDGYQTHLNALLRREMLRDLEKRRA